MTNKHKEDSLFSSAFASILSEIINMDNKQKEKKEESQEELISSFINSVLYPESTHSEGLDNKKETKKEDQSVNFDSLMEVFFSPFNEEDTFQKHTASNQSNKPSITEKKAPPIGIVPHAVWLSTRKEDLKNAMKRYTTAGLPIPIEWLEEYYE